MDGYDVAQVCPNGHVANAYVHRFPQHNKAFCADCGEATLSACPSCNRPIRGRYCAEGAYVIGEQYKLPAFCTECGNAFPWTERLRRAAIDLFIEEIEEKKAREEFEQSVNEISKDTPQAQVAATRITRLLRLVRENTAPVLQKMVADLASAGIKQMIG